VSTQANSFLTPEQYLEIERKAEYKSEYLNGEMFAMVGAKRVHNLVEVTNRRLKAVALVTGCKPCSGRRPAR
jgi:hypothetical protein